MIKNLALTMQAFAVARKLQGKWWTTIASGKASDKNLDLLSCETDGITCIWTPTCAAGTRLLVISCPEVFLGGDETDAATVAGRIGKLIRAGMDGGRLPPNLGPFRSGTKASVFAYDYGAGKSRIVGEARPMGSEDYYVCAFDDSDAWNLSNYTPDYAAYLSAKSAVNSCVGVKSMDPTINSIELDAHYATAAEDIGLNLAWDFWYSRQANPQQKSFIDLEFDRPLRLRGGPGTGKTVTLAVKALKLLRDAKNQQEKCRVLILTHSWALAEAIDELIDGLDPKPMFRDTLRSLEVWPLLSLADSKVQLGAASRRLLGSDSRQGKVEMLRRIGESLKLYIDGDWIARRGGCRPEFQASMEASISSNEHKVLQWDILNEIATVFAAAGIHPRKRADYLKLRRKAWMMKLETDDEKHVILDVYKAYFEGLQRDKLTGPEQLISDYLRELGTFEWERLRLEEGYDYLFVDEMHLFDEQERFVLHQLLADGDARPRVAMAMDPQQSALELFVNLASDTTDSSEIYKRANLREPTKIDLNTTFRHTQSIARFMQALTEQGMHLQFGDEWETPATETPKDADEGAPPTTYEHLTRAIQFKVCFSRAMALARQGQRGRCAVICLDAERFDDYAVSVSAQFGGFCTVIQSEQDVTDALHYKGRRFIVSLPDFVGGLQFDSVIVMDVNEDDCGGEGNAFLLRRFTTDLYLACSRAKTLLELHSTADRGGRPALLRVAIDRGIIEPA